MFRPPLSPRWLVSIALVLALGQGEEARGLTASGALHDARAAFDRQQYDQALALVESAVSDASTGADALRLKTRALARLGRPVEALGSYDQFQTRNGREDGRVLREVAFSFVTAVLKDMREQTRGAGYSALKEWDTDETIPYFEDGLSDGSGLVRALVAEGLGRLEKGRRSPRLRTALQDQAAMVRATALRVLGRSGDKTVIPLVEGLLKDDQAIVRVAAAGALVRLGKAEAWDTLRRSAEAPNPEERGAALRTLGDLADPRALPLLREALQDPQPSIRGAAAAALGDLGLREAMPLLTDRLDDTIPAVRISAAISLGELSAEDAAPRLKQALGDINPAVRAAAASALFRMGRADTDTITTVRELAQNSDPGIRAAAARSLARVGSKSHRGRSNDLSAGLDILKALLTDPLPRPRIAAARALGHIGGEALVPVLKQALRDQDDAVRATAGGALGRTIGTRGTGA